MRTIGYAAYSPTSPLALFQFERRSLWPNDVAMEILLSRSSDKEADALALGADRLLVPADPHAAGR